MQETAPYQKIMKELIGLPVLSKGKFNELYHLVHTSCNLVDDSERVHNQSQFGHYIKTIIRKLPKYYEVLRNLVEAEAYLPVVKNDLLDFLDQHYGPENIHRLVVDYNDKESLKLAMAKMYDNVFDMKKLGMLLSFDDYGINYFYEIKQPDGSVHISDSDAQIEEELFDAIVADEDLRGEVLKYIDLINAIHYTMGSEGDIRFNDHRIIFESPMKALLKLSPAYIPLLIECYAVFNKWHDVSALSIGFEMLVSLYPDADEMIYLYASAYGRAMANYELIDTFEDVICEKLNDKVFRLRFIKLLAADNLAGSIGMSYEHGQLKGDDLREEIEVGEWEEDIAENHIGQYLKDLCSEDDYDDLVGLYNDTIDALIDGEEEAEIRLVPVNLPSLTGIRLNDDGNVQYDESPSASIVYDTDQAGFISYMGKDYLLTCDEGLIRIVDFEEKKQFTVRHLRTDDSSVSDLLTCSQIQNDSPVHFVTLSGGVIQAWHMGTGLDTFKIRANASHIFLTADGRKLAILIENDEDVDEDFKDKGDVFNIDLSNEKPGTVIYFELDSLSEISRWTIPFSDFDCPILTMDGNNFFVMSSGDNTSVVKWDANSGKRLDTYKNLGDFGTCIEMAISPDSQKLIVDRNVYTLPDMEFYTSVGNYDYGNIFVSGDSKIVIKCGDSAGTEDSFNFSDLKTGKYLGRLNYLEDTYRPSIVFTSPCGTYFCAIVDGDLTIWNLQQVLDKMPEDEMEKFEIDFPSVPVRMLVGNRIISISETKGNFINEYKNPRFSLLEHGEFRTEAVEAPSCEGREKVIFTEAKLLRETNALIPVKGKSFGVKLLATPQGRQQFFDVKVSLCFPERMDPETGELISKLEWYQQINANEPVFIGWEFQDESEFKPGTWMLEISNMENTDYLFRQLFYIKKAFKAIDYTINKSFLGLYSDPDVGGDKLSESRTIVGKAGISFGLQFKFECADLEDTYTLMGEMEHPAMCDSRTGVTSTLTKRKFILRDGNGIGFFKRFADEDEVTEGKWIFRILDPGLGTVLMEEELEIISAEDAGESEFELLDSGVYAASDKVSLYKNYPKGDMLELVSAEDTIVLEEGLVLGFRYQFKNLMQGKRLAAMVYHPPIKSFFGTDTEEDFDFNINSSEPQFIGWVMERDKYLVEGDWCFKVWENEVDEDEAPLFEKTFQLIK